ncbi:hypothetical protein GGX14DRAFT_347988 [Mycena pura]|uniref:Uncharacterized protein n=1 Tax=Mycena pura TaxID=153505 RepID=A0AAD6YQT8_9AGAR|nr:hypothetical protein GGX14DRAFT_347988 [Mycena pura]
MLPHISRFRVNQDSTLSASQESGCFEFCIHPDPTLPTPRRGSFQYDLASSKFPKQWKDWSKFQDWLQQEQRQHFSTILGKCCEEHDHTIGNANLRFTRISKDTCEHIAGLLCLKVAPDHVVHHYLAYNNDLVFDDESSVASVGYWSKFIQLHDIRQIEKEIEAEAVRLHPDNSISTL